MGRSELVVAYAKKNPQGPFADSGEAIERILAKLALILVIFRSHCEALFMMRSFPCCTCWAIPD